VGTALINTHLFLKPPPPPAIMSDDWDSKTVIGFKRQVAKVTKKDSDLNGM
jgi:hypothetical protein